MKSNNKHSKLWGLSLRRIRQLYNACA